MKFVSEIARKYVDIDICCKLVFEYTTNIRVLPISPRTPIDSVKKQKIIDNLEAMFKFIIGNFYL